MTMQKYVLGFAFSEDLKHVVLIEKKRGPEHIIGKWNGVGGKVDPFESDVFAMAREFEEETGIITSTKSWLPYGSLSDTSESWSVSLFTTILKWEDEEVSVTDEVVSRRPVSLVLAGGHPIAHNIPALCAGAIQALTNSSSEEIIRFDFGGSQRV